MKTTGERIRDLRLRQRLTLDDVARILGIGRQAVYKYEQGTVTNIPLENIEKMAALFNTTPGYIAGWTENELSFDENRLLTGYRSLSPHGKDLLHDRCEELKVLYGKKSEDRPAESV